jgi:succinyl-CoA synthetase beta subunit
LKVHEYQAKALFKSYGLPVPDGGMAETPDEARKLAKGLPGPRYVVKAQIHAGGRGKAGGVKVVDSPEAAAKVAESLLGKPLVTLQTGPKGSTVHRVLVEAGLEIESEFYAGFVIDRAARRAVLMASAEGGVEIETVAAERPEAIFKEYVDPALGLRPYQARRMAFALGLGPQQRLATDLFMKLYKAFTATDASLVEINPLVLTADGQLLLLDAKLSLDDSALPRHKPLLELRDTHEEDEREVEASKFNLNYIKLDGRVGCMVNGAGLAMATMDLIKLNGSEPANFLDVGGGASVERISAAFRILSSDPDVEAILINIFGGIVRCDRVADGVIQALKDLDVKVPITVRLEGTNAEEAAKTLEASDLEFTVATSFADAAAKAVASLPAQA